MDTHVADCAMQAGPDHTPLAACGVDHGCVQNILPNLNNSVVWVAWSGCQLKVQDDVKFGSLALQLHTHDVTCQWTLLFLGHTCFR
jgi:hypothetical protein